MYDDRDVVIQATQDVLERSPGGDIRPPGAKDFTFAGDWRCSSGLKALLQGAVEDWFVGEWAACLMGTTALN